MAFLAAILPVLWLAVDAAMGNLGARPLMAAIHFTGLFAVRFLLLSLAVTPVRRLFDWPKLVLARRCLGVAAFGYAALHLALYVADQGFNLATVGREIVLRFYLAIGAIALVFLLILASTSFDRVIRRMGGRRWLLLHRSVYLVAPLALAHFLIQSKLDVTEPIMMMGFLILLFGYRLVQRVRVELTAAVAGGLALIAGLLTALGEIAWYGLATGVDPWLVAEANLTPGLGISPALWVAGSGLGVAGAAAVWRRLRPPRDKAVRLKARSA
ncbi:sulfite oxidase heme-binding subunit YedZ [Aquabacter spiritensis]|uniref:sulfite oxidase heme-binding subunit YedZ n=1 Tax=Aquabacter spiritensis TaxID=933073 RepID=UPI001FE0D1E6|nr:protein-methionine-sulfoxide reductase heme-binding subunit MsrQ [Aquabacter spiritensis]